MKNIEKYFLVVLCVLMYSLAQAQEENVAFDSQNKIFKLNAELEKGVDLYAGDGEFSDAELFKSNDSTFIIELHFLKEGKTFRERKQINSIQLADLRTKVDSALLQYTKETDPMEGRGLLLGASLLSGLTTYGPGLMGIANTSSVRINTGLYMLGASSLFFVPYFATKNIPVSYGQANLVYYGLSRGFGHGALLGISLENEKDISMQLVSTAGTIIGITEAFVGFHLVKELKISNGNANLMTVYGDIGLFTGMGMAIQIFDLTEDDFNSQLFAGLTLAGSVGSEIAGYYVGKKHQISAGDAEIIQTTALLGAFLPFTYTSTLEDKKISTFTTPSLLMGIAGLYVGHVLTKNVDYSFTQGFITKIGTVAGGLLGAGITYLVIGDTEPWVYITGTYVGANASFILLSAVKNPIFRNNSAKNIGFNFMPENFLMGQQLQKRNPEMRGMLPIARLTYSF